MYSYWEISSVHRAIATSILHYCLKSWLWLHMSYSPIWLLRFQNRYSRSWGKIRIRPRPFSWVQNNLPWLSFPCTVKPQTSTCSLQFSLKKIHVALFTSSSSAFSSSSSDSRSSLLFLRRRLAGLLISFTWQPMPTLGFLLFPLFLQSSGMSLVSLNVQNWKQKQIKRPVIFLQYSQCLCTCLAEWGCLRCEPKEMKHVCMICRKFIF